KAKPGELNVVLVPGLTEMVWDGFARAMDLKFTKVPFANLGQGAAEMGTGRVDVMMSAVAIMQPVLQAKSARLIGVNGRERVQIFAETPTVAEAGAPSLQYEGLIGLFGPRAMSPELRRRVGEEVAEIARQRDIADKLVASGQTPNPGGSEEFAADIAEQEKQVAAIAQQLGLKRKD
ncbi:MAG TPA: tripartite tricarboxylate transporter substrate-binding protein, partial [Beijerinckiaceae bacterium]